MKQVFSLPAWPMFLAALAMVGAICAVAIYRRISMPRVAGTCIAAGMLLLALACGGPVWHRPAEQEVAVMVDLSASTRTAQYRDAEALHRRIAQLLGRVPRHITYFAAENHTSIPESRQLADLPGDRTMFTPPDAAAVLLFSDCQFELPAASPPVYIAVDPLLEDPPDAAVRRLELNRQTLTAIVDNQSNSRRQLTISPAALTLPPPGVPGEGMKKASEVTRGASVMTTRLPAAVGEAAARLSPGDPWPENDVLAIRVPPPVERQRWWVGVSPPPGEWKALAPTNLPSEAADYLTPAAIVLNNVAAADLSELQQQRLQQYVRDLGGSLVILGGDHAFAGGGYPGTLIESLSPLASTPPTPTLHWIILGDSSGSMASGDGKGGGPSRWDQVKQAMLRLLPKLPPEDPVTIGSFAENLRWWSRGKTARETAALPLPPADVRPNGPTNLEQALLSIIASADASMPKELLLLSDCDAQVVQVDELKRGLMEKKIRLDLLALSDDGRALRQLEELVKATGGQSLRELDPAKWTQAIQKLYEQSAPPRISTQPLDVLFSSGLASLPARSVAPWNRTWLRKSATELANGRSAEGPSPAAARWQVGAGTVLSATFSPTPTEADAMAGLIAQPPRDPRFKITWDTGPRLRITVDAVDGRSYLNNLSFSLDLSTLPPTSPSPTLSIRQTGPGRYELSIPAPRQPVFATIRQDQRVLDRQAIAGRYAPEFDAIGNNTGNMRDLAGRSGGAVIPPSQTRPIDFNWPHRDVPLTPWLACAGALLIAMGLIRWRL